MQQRIAHRQEQLKAQQQRVQGELDQLEQRRQVLLQELLQVTGALSLCAELLAACDVVMALPEGD